MKKLILCSALLAVAVMSSAGAAGNGKGNNGKGNNGNNNGGTVGNATTADVTLDGQAADFFKYASGVNPHGKEGASGFAMSFKDYGQADGWNKISGFETAPTKSATDSVLVLNSNLLFSFTNTNGTKGTWSIQNNDLGNDLTLDLVFAMHTGGGSGAWLFDDQTILAGQTISGNWVQKMFNNGGQMGGFSNLTLFTRDAVAKAKVVEVPTDLPEPASLATVGLGLGLMGLLRRRRRN